MTERMLPTEADCWVLGSATWPATGSGPLAGLTLAVKDMFALAGHVSSFGHPRWRETHGPSTGTAPVLSALLAAGASIAGLAKLDQIAWSVVGNAGEGIPPLNPVYPDRFTCGSSSGPASAVAAGLADIGLGTDTGGSIRAPAAACGLFGLRPTHGLISAAGVLPLAPSFDTVGIMTRELDASGRALEVLTGRPGAAAVVRRVVIPADCLADVAPSTADAVRNVAAGVAHCAGCELAEQELGAFLNSDVVDLFARIQAREVWTTNGPWLAANADVLAADVAERVQRAEALSAGPPQDRLDDERAWHAYTAALSQSLPDDTIAVLPVLAGLALSRTASQADVGAFRSSTLRYTAPASLTGRPELVIPVRHAATGLQIGVGLLGPRGSDAGLVRIASQLCPPQGLLAV